MKSMLQLSVMSECDARTVCTWVYSSPYHIYNWPSWEEMCKKELEFSDHTIRTEQYCCIYRELELIGYIQLFPLEQVIRLAIFLSPQHCNQGLGQEAVALAIKEALRRNAEADIDLEVECWNRRAIACYKKAGFSITDQYQYMQRGVSKEVYCMVYNRLLS
ncbi:GNAT family N-acetyltransferase [Paenibacillus camelliae]|uniref:GNAT family N-acetyltransferase n=1 Tax=Paenibacillus camelliae TaxID=512410 RepID=UPI00203BE997|nr:GNAT family N-acetyltransferase [Paenibacillus camelliae]MCM3635791.1 GNAT family N-acetyltransferase [Paenibacillus camelliae]